MRKHFERNMGSGERWASMALGAGLVGWGWSRRGWPSRLAALGGASLIARGVSGYCPIHAMTRRNGERQPSPQDFHDRGIRIEESIVVDRPAHKLYFRWRKLDNLPELLPHVESVTVLDERRSHWVVRGPAGATLEWDAEIYTDEPGRRISWKSLPDASVHHVGSLNFEPQGDHSTLVRVILEYIPPGGTFGSWAAGILGADPAEQVRSDLRRFKAKMEHSEPVAAGTKRAPEPVAR